jgi:hypothetical protein
VKEEQLALDAGFIFDWQHLDADRNIAASAAIMRGGLSTRCLPQRPGEPRTVRDKGL